MIEVKSKEELIHKIRNLPIDEREINRYPPEIDELSLLISNEIIIKISEQIGLTLTIRDWDRCKAIIQSKLAYTIRRIKFSPPSIPKEE